MHEYGLSQDSKRKTADCYLTKKMFFIFVSHKPPWCIQYLHSHTSLPTTTSPATCSSEWEGWWCRTDPRMRWATLVNQVMCLFVWDFMYGSRIFHSCGDVTIAGEWRTCAKHLWPLSREGALACHTYCDTGHPFIMVISKDLWHSHSSCVHIKILVVQKYG